MLEKVNDWIGFVFCETAFRMMPDEMVERCIYQALGESDEDIDGYVTFQYEDYRYYDQAFFTVGSTLYRIGCLFYAMGEASGPRLILPKHFVKTDGETEDE